MKHLEHPIEFEAELIGEDEENFIFKIPQEVQDKIPKEAKYLYCTIKFLEDKKGLP